MLGFLVKTELLGNSVLDWIMAACAMVAVTAVVMLSRAFIERRLGAEADPDGPAIDKRLAEAAGGTRWFFALAMGLMVALVIVDLGLIEGRLLQGIVVACLVQVGLWGSGAVTFAVQRFAKSRHDPEVGGAVAILRTMALVVVWALILLLVLAAMGLNITAGVAGLGIGGVALALAVQNVLVDMFASLAIVFDRPFLVGDYIEVGDEKGTVEQIGLKTTRVRAIGGELLLFSNNDLLGSRIHNFQTMAERRVSLTVGLSCETSRSKVGAVSALLRAAVEGQEGARFIRSHFAAFAASSFDFEVVYYVDSREYGHYMDVQEAVNLAVLAAFEAEGLEFAYPTRTVWVRGAEEDGAGPVGAVAAAVAAAGA